MARETTRKVKSHKPKNTTTYRHLRQGLRRNPQQYPTGSQGLGMQADPTGRPYASNHLPFPRKQPDLPTTPVDTVAKHTQLQTIEHELRPLKTFRFDPQHKRTQHRLKDPVCGAGKPTKKRPSAAGAQAGDGCKVPKALQLMTAPYWKHYAKCMHASVGASLA
jgi:hypothetical protein